MDKRERILEVAEELFLTNSIENTSVNQITRQAHVAKGTFYLYFEDKDELVFEIVNRFVDKTIIKALEKASTEDWLESFFKTLIDFYCREPAVLKLLYEPLFLQADRPDRYDEKLCHFAPLINRLVQEGYRPESAKIKLALAMETLGTLCFLSIILEKPAPIEKTQHEIIRMATSVFQKGGL